MIVLFGFPIVVRNLQKRSIIEHFNLVSHPKPNIVSSAEHI